MRFCPTCKFQLDLEKTIEGENGIGFFFCKSCHHTSHMEDGDVILEFPRKAGDLMVTTLDPVASVHDNYPRKKLESCGNTKCPTRKRDGKPVEVVVWKDDNFNIRYICVECSHVMTP